MFQSAVFVLAVLGVVMQCGYSLGELSPLSIIAILATWLTLFGVTAAMGWPGAVIIVGTIVVAVGLILKVFGGDIRIR